MHYIMYTYYILELRSMYEHRIMKCKEKKSAIAKMCEKMGSDGWEFAGQFQSRFLYFFRRNYLIFTRSSK